MLPRLNSYLHFCAIFAIFCLMLFLMHPDCFYGLSTGYIGGARGDAGIYIYLERINATRFFSWPSEGFDLPTFYPYKRALAYSDNFLLPSLIAKVLYVFSSSEALAYNLIIIGALTLNGASMYLLTLSVTGSRGSALFAGFTFLSCPYFAFHRGHPQLQFGFWIPLTLLATIRYFEKRSLARASLIGASVTGAFFCSVYYAMYCYLLAGLTLGVLFVSRPSSWRMRNVVNLIAGNVVWLLFLVPAMGPYLEVRNSLGTNPMAILRMHSPALSAFISAPAIEELWSPLTKQLSHMEGYLFFGFIPMGLALWLALEHLIHLCKDSLDQPLLGEATTRVQIELEKSAGGYGETFARIFRVPSSAKASFGNDLCNPTLATRGLGYFMTACLFIGAIRGTYFLLHAGSRTPHHLAWIQSETLWALLFGLLLTIGMRGFRRKAAPLDRRETLSILLFCAVFFTFATLGIHDGGAIQRPAPELYRMLIGLPGFNALRGLARMGIVVIMLATLIAAFAITRLKGFSLFSTQKRYSLLCISLIVLTGIELHTRKVSLALENPPPNIYSSVRQISQDAALLALPIGSAAKDGRSSMIWNSLYALWMKEYKNPIVNGFSGKVPPFQALSGHLLNSFPSQESLSVLGTLVGVRYVITNHRHYGEQKVRRIRTAAAKLPDQIKEIACDSKLSCLFEVNSVIATAILPSTDLLIPWDARPRTLSLEVQAAPDAAEMHHMMRLSLLSRGHLVRPPDLLNVAPKGGWQTATVAIPDVQERVTPLVLAITVENNAPLLIRNVKLIQAEHLPISTTQEK